MIFTKSLKICVIFLSMLVLMSVSFAEHATLENKEHLGGIYFKDSDKIYLKEVHGSLHSFSRIDTKTFEVLMGESFAKDKNNVFFHRSLDCGLSRKLVTVKADNKSFEGLNKNFGKDKESVFYQTKKIVGADPTTFKVLNEYYAFDANFAYFQAQPVTDVNLKKFEVFGADERLEYFAKDDKSIYRLGSKLSVTDIESFEPLSPIIFKDKNNIYCIEPQGSYSVLSVDYETFAMFEHGYYGRDKNSVYRLYFECTDIRERIVAGLDPKTTDVIDVDPLRQDILKDDSRVYLSGIGFLTVDIDSFEYLGGVYFKDKNYVYDYDGKLLKGVDPKTFNPESFDYLEWEKNNLLE